ncbi:hypothetical protein GCM10023185_26200 [Hymenobacter saemangeumensis]|uniref:Carboxypeptidase-like regulatory domain-containing protein n=1 Tax=Hymenobacter saemangeumensis TaxID=1084522 RepID=A0ABP8III8_9BACT
MKTLLTSAFFFAATFLVNHPGKAQLACTRVVMPEDILLSANINVAAGPVGPKVMYGVVQGMSGVLPGATVWLHGSSTVAVANSDGVFELPVPAGATEVEITCSYAGLQEEVLTLPVAEPSNTVYLLRAQTPKGKHFVSDLTFKERYGLTVKKVPNPAQ